MPEVTTSGAMSAARTTFDKTIGLVVKVFVPVGAAVAGFFLPAVLGGGWSIGNVIYQGTSGSLGTMSSRAGWAAQALINGMVGGAFWHMRSMGGLIAEAIGGAVGGFFLGGALGCLPGLFNGQPAPTGLIDHLVSSISAVATEG